MTSACRSRNVSQAQFDLTICTGELIAVDIGDNLK